jgi:hypothetical protein
MNNPFENLDKTDAPPAEKPQKEESGAAGYFLELTMGEEEYDQPAAFVPAKMPADRAWIPVQILEARIVVNDMRRVLTDPDTGAETIEDKVPTPQFELKVQHAANCYGERGYPYLIGMAKFPLCVEDVTIPFKDENNPKGLGFQKKSGRKLVAATQVLDRGERITQDNLEKLTADMVGKIVMAQVRRVDRNSTNSVPVLDSFRQTVRVKVNASDTKVQIVEKGGQFVMKEDGSVFLGDTSRLFKHEGIYYILDPSDDGELLKKVQPNKRTFDNLQTDVAPVPSRSITVIRTGGEAENAEITWDTIGQITAKPVKAGTPVQAVTAGGELLTATWIGTMWTETPVTHNLEINELGAVTFVPVNAGEQDSGNPLDVFKGDSTE